MTQVLSRADSIVHSLASEMVESDRLVLCDLDGCLVSECRAFGDAAAFVRACADRFWIVSNNSTHSADGLSTALARLGLAVPSDRILLAGEETLRHIAAERAGARLALFGSPEMERLARLLGFVLDFGRPDLVLLCRDTQLSLTRLDALTAALRMGAELWISNPDTAHPGENGQPIAETGALLAAVEAILGRMPYHSLGKPDPHMANAALDRSGCAPSDAVFIGDNPLTDGAVAKAAGVRFIRLARDARQTEACA